MTNKNLTIALCLLPFLAACGYKGDLYLPKENDKARFGVIQTGLDWRKPNPQTAEPKPNNQQNNQKQSTSPSEQ